MTAEALARAARAIREADALVITAGAGMGVDSGLPDFRGPEGFWRAYPPLAALGLRFEDAACAHWFETDPHLAWGFYGHRLNLYRTTEPHAGFAILQRWAARKRHGAFVITSNVDGQFQKAGFPAERVLEVHGSIHRLQCRRPACGPTWLADGVEIAIDEETLRAAEPLPRCPTCGGIARPNLLMFDDFAWDYHPYRTTEQALDRWERGVSQARVAVVEVGAGRAIPTMRWQSEALYGSGAALVRINPREASAPTGAISLPLGALDALTQIDALL